MSFILTYQSIDKDIMVQLVGGKVTFYKSCHNWFDSKGLFSYNGLLATLLLELTHYIRLLSEIILSSW